MCSYGRKKNEIILFENQGVKLEVNVNDNIRMYKKSDLKMYNFVH